MSAEPPPDVVDVDVDIAGCGRSQRALVEHLRSTDPVDPATPSLLPGWTLGHVLTHIARNADSHHRMLDGLRQYEGGAAERDAAIEAGAGRPWGELVADVEASCAALEARWAAIDGWDAVVPTRHGETTRRHLPAMRWSEVEIHRADLGLGYGFDDMPAEYLRRALRRLEMQWTARQPMGMTALPPQALAASPALRLAWLAGRADIVGLPHVDET